MNKLVEKAIIVVSGLAFVFSTGWLWGERDYNFNENFEDCIARGGEYSFASNGRFDIDNYEFCRIEEKIRY